MEDAASDIHDWEVVLQGGEDGEFISKSSSMTSLATAEVAADEGGAIQPDYFTLDYHHQRNPDYVGIGGPAPISESSSADSDNPSWVDPSGSSAVGSETSTVDQDNLLSYVQPHSGCGRGAHHDSNIPNELEIGLLDQSFNEEFHDAAEGEEGQQQLQSGVVVVAEDDEVSRLRSEEERERERESETRAKKEKRVVWWKQPMEVLRYCVMRVGPVWSFSVAAAAVMGLVIFHRRYLYKLKRKAQAIQLKVIVDDKKVSQFMTRAARLNEAFSVVKRVPIIRPALPAPGMVPWPVVSMR